MTTFTEAPLSINLRVGDYQLTGRASTRDEIREKKAIIDEIAAEILGGSKQHASTPAPQPTVEHAEQAFRDAGVQVSPVPTGGIEERTDRFGNRYQRGNPDLPSCPHGQRVVAYKTSKAGKPYKAYACVNDTPFGDFKAGKCKQEYPDS